jgi:hypothetical protein
MIVEKKFMDDLTQAYAHIDASAKVDMMAGIAQALQ